MGVKEEIQDVEQEISGLRESWKNVEKEGTEEQKRFLYQKISRRMKRFVGKIKIRLFVLGFYNKELKRKLYATVDLIFKANELLCETSMMFEKHEKGEEENIMEYDITIKQLEKKIKMLDKGILEKAKLMNETRQKPIYAEIGAMLLLRHISTLFVLLDKQTESSASLLEKLEKESGLLNSENSASPLNASNRHRPTNSFFPL